MAWYPGGWTKRKQITIDNTKVGGSGSHPNFPVLVNLASDAQLAASARLDGFDILFTASDEVTKLDHEIEKYVTGTGELVAFVRIPSLSTSVDTVIYMYYGNSGASDQSNKTGVWNSNYKGVWHLSEDPGAVGTDGIQDSTSNGWHLTDAGGMVSGDSVPVKIGNGLEFDGNEYLERADTYPTFTKFTVSGWVEATSYSAASCQLLQLQDTAAANGPKANVFQCNNSAPRFYLRNDASGTDSELFTNTFTNNQLYWVVITWNGDTGVLDFYIDGTLDSTDISFLGGAITPDVIRVARMQLDDAAFQYHIGKLDDIRLSDIARDKFWIATEWNNQNSPGTFYSLGTEQTPPGYANTVNGVAGVGAVNTVAGASINQINTV